MITEDQTSTVEIISPYPRLPSPPLSSARSILFDAPDSPVRLDQRAYDSPDLPHRIKTPAEITTTDATLSPSTSNGVDFSLNRVSSKRLRKGPPPILGAKSLKRRDSRKVKSVSSPADGLGLTTIGLVEARSSSPGGSGVGGYVTAESLGDSDQEFVVPQEG